MKKILNDPSAYVDEMPEGLGAQWISLDSALDRFRPLPPSRLRRFGGQGKWARPTIGFSRLCIQAPGFTPCAMETM